MAPARPRDQPPSLPRSPSPLGSMSSLHDVLKVRFLMSVNEKMQPSDTFLRDGTSRFPELFMF